MLKSNLKICIIGPGRCGKDTAAEFLSKITPMVYTAGTSYWARHIVFNSLPWHKRLWYWNADRCWRIHRHKDRQYWAKKIGEYNQDDPVALYRNCLKEQNFLTGVRWRHEFEAIKAAGLCDLWVWIDRPGCVDPTCELTEKDCDFTVKNDGTLLDFKLRLAEVAFDRDWVDPRLRFMRPFLNHLLTLGDQFQCVEQVAYWDLKTRMDRKATA